MRHERFRKFFPHDAMKGAGFGSSAFVRCWLGFAPKPPRRFVDRGCRVSSVASPAASPRRLASIRVLDQRDLLRRELSGFFISELRTSKRKPPDCFAGSPG
jgi:hypothetical protein